MSQQTLDATFTALADAHRRGVIKLLRTRPRRAGELAEKLGLAPPAMSKHLRVLRESGLIEPSFDEADARAKVYALRKERFSELREWLEGVERFWDDQLDAFKAFAEKKR
ncbi:MAG: winged helix-turn-helix transcriptional regulator [Archangium sp.]|nr:winged helix-turn-helix transcriptional regulator [Archangium sp.]